MSEMEEATRVIIMLGQLLVPGAQEVARLLGRAVVLAGMAGKEHAARAYDEAVSRLDAHGSSGWVDERRLRGRALDFVAMPEAMGRADLSEFGQACRKFGVAFSVQEMEGRACLVFDAKDRQTIKGLSDALLDSYHVGADERRSIEDVRQPVGDFAHAGCEWTQAGGVWSARIADMQAQITADGGWRLMDGEDHVATTPAGALLEGRVSKAEGPVVLAAAEQAAAYARTVSDKGLMTADRAIGYQTPERLSKAVGSKEVMASVDNARAKDRHKGHAHERAKTAGKVVRR